AGHLDNSYPGQRSRHKSPHRLPHCRLHIPSLRTQRQMLCGGGGYRGEGLCGPAPLLDFSWIGATSVLRRRRATSSLVISIAACLPASPTSLRASTRCEENRSRSAKLTRRIVGLS